MPHEGPHLRPLPNRVKSSKAQLSNRDPHPCPCTNTDSHGAHCHTRTLSHDPFIGAKHGAAYARDGARKTGRETRNNGRTRKHRNHSSQGKQRTRTPPHYKPPTSTKQNQSHTQYHSRQNKSPRDTKLQQNRHTQPKHCQTDLSTKNKVFSHKTTTNRPIDAETSLPSQEQSCHPPQTEHTRPIPASTITNRTPPGLQRHTQ